MDIAELLAFSVKNKASDLHLSAGLPPMIRVHGDVRRINLPPMEHKDVAAFNPVLPAYNLSGAQVAGYSDQYIYAMIRVGRGLMPEYGSRITNFDRWNVINYVRQLQRQAGN